MYTTVVKALNRTDLPNKEMRNSDSLGEPRGANQMNIGNSLGLERVLREVSQSDIRSVTNAIQENRPKCGWRIDLGTQEKILSWPR